MTEIRGINRSYENLLELIRRKRRNYPALIINLIGVVGGLETLLFPIAAEDHESINYYNYSSIRDLNANEHKYFQFSKLFQIIACYIYK